MTTVRALGNRAEFSLVVLTLIAALDGAAFAQTGTPASCSASDDLPGPVTVQWERVAGALHYRVYRDDQLIGFVPAADDHFDDNQATLGVHQYCVRAYLDAGEGPPCCDSGTRNPVPAPAQLTASDDLAGVQLTWSSVDLVDGYRVYRDSELIATVPHPTTEYFDAAFPGTYSYCVRAYRGTVLSDPICDSGTIERLLAPSSCEANETSGPGVIFTWEPVGGAQFYDVLRDGVLIHTVLAGVTTYTDVGPLGPHSYCVRARNASQTSPPCCDSGSLYQRCLASKDRAGSVVLSWTDTPGESNYEIRRDGVVVGTTQANTTDFIDFPPEPGTYEYCILGVSNSAGLGPCCDLGQSLELGTPGPCSATDVFADGVRITWPHVAGADGYRIFRNGTQIASVPVGTSAYNDVVGIGTYEYCVRASFGGVLGTPCCDIGHVVPLEPPPPPATCSATFDLPSGVELTWAAVPDVTVYQIFRDGAQISAVPGDETELFDVPEFGWHEYCVRAVRGLATGVVSEPCCASGARGSGVAGARLSWQTCTPQIRDETWEGPQTYELVASVVGVGVPVIGYDTSVRISPDVSDAWRFDASGCQDVSRLDWNLDAPGGCPSLTGENELPFFDYSYDDASRRARIRVLVTFDSRSTTPETRYVLWRVAFDHAQSVPGTDGLSSTCDGADRNLRFDITGTILLEDGSVLALIPSPLEEVVTWGGRTVGTQKTTLGRIKALYR